MSRAKGKLRERAFVMRVERKSFADISRALEVSPKTISRWEQGWTTASGRSHTGWKPRLEQSWKELAEAELKYGLMVKEERIKAYEELARMAINRVKEMFPTIKAKTAVDAKALLSEIRELLRLIAKEKGELGSAPSTVVAVQTDISLGELQARYTAAKVIEAKEVPSPQEDDKDDVDSLEEPAGPAGTGEVARDE